MPRPSDINPRTGKRYNFVDPNQASKDLASVHSELALLERLQMAQQARSALMKFIRFTTPDVENPEDITKSAYKNAKFHDEIAKVLEQVESGEITQLIFCMPPRHGKTQEATIDFSAWYAGKHPEHDVAVAMATDELASDVGANVRAKMNSAQYKQVFPKFKLRRGGAAKDNIQTEKGGRMVFVGRGGTLNGRGAHLLLVDDLYKDDEEARSPAVRDAAWNWFVKVALFRRMGKKLTVLTMTRWHSDDVIGRLTDPENPHYNAQEAASWKIIRLPGLAEEDDPLGRAPGETLWDDERDEQGNITTQRFSREYWLAAQRRDPLGFAALVQQRPTVADGILFRRETIQYYVQSELPETLTIYAASDHAVGQNQRNDSSVFILVGVDPQNNIYILDCYWRKASSDQAVEAILAMASGKMRPVVWWAEKGHISKSIGPFLRQRMVETGKYINIHQVTPVKDKTQRAQSIAARVAMGKVYFPKNAVWTERAINEMLAFPNGTHDDFVDAIAYIGLGLRSLHAPSAPSKKNEEPKFGTIGWVKRQDDWRKQQERTAAARGF